MQKLFLLGLGAIGKSFLKKIVELDFFGANNIYCIDASSEEFHTFVSFGLPAEHFCCDTVNEENYQGYLSKIKPRDYLFDFATNIKNLEIIEYVLEKGIHYLSLADSGWNHDSSFRSIHQHFLEYKQLKNKYYNQKGPTVLVEFGMNPGMVSIFAKKCLEEIVENDCGYYVKHNRKKLQECINQNEWGRLAKSLQVEYITEVDNDDQIFEINRETGTIYSPWCPEAFRVESLSAPEISFGNKKLFYQFDRVSDCDFDDYYVALAKPAIECEESFFSPQHMANGYLTSHEEVFTLNDFFSFGKFKVTTAFVYASCTEARNSVIANKKEQFPKYKLLNRDSLIGGGESVGIIIQGKRFSTRYFGNYLNSPDLDETATVRQVSASAVAAFQYMIAHSNEGLLFPEDIESNEILDLARPYLQDYISCECPSIKLNYGK